MAFIPLAPLVPAWDDHYIPEVYAFIEKGLRRLQAHYWLHAFALVSYVTSYNEDNSISTFRFELGVRSDREAAERACTRLLRARMLEAMVGVDAEWQVENDNYSETRELARFPPKIEMLCWETRGGDWDHVTVFIGLVALDPLHPFTGEDVGAMGRKHDIIPILRRLGGTRRWLGCLKTEPQIGLKGVTPAFRASIREEGRNEIPEGIHQGLDPSAHACTSISPLQG